MPRSALLRLVPDASPALCELLDAGRGALLPPIRSEIFGPQRFAQHGRSLGDTHRGATPQHRGGAFFPRLRSNIAVLREAYRTIAQHASTGHDISPAAEWLLDNFHLIEAQLEEVHEGLPRGYFRRLPVLREEPLAGLPRIYGVAWAFVAHTDGAFDEDLLAQFLRAYQGSCELQLSEMWALPTTLRVVLIENLRRLAERVAAHKAAREMANLCADRLSNWSVRALEDLLALLTQRGVGQVFLTQLAQRLQDARSTALADPPAADAASALSTEAADEADEGADAATVASRRARRPPGMAPATVRARLHARHRARQHEWLRNALPDPAAQQAQHDADQTADNLSVSNAVTSLRAIGDADWPDIIASTSTLMQVLLTAPLFAAEHTVTRDQTLHAIEHLARRQGCSEVVLAQALVGLMRAAGNGAGAAAEAVAAYWLQGPGLPALLQALGGPARAPWPWRTWQRRAALPVYLASLVLGTAGLVAWMLGHWPTAEAAGGFNGWRLAAGLLMLWPASEAVAAVMHRLISESAQPRRLPRLALPHGIPPEHRVLVVIPAMLTSPAATRALVHRLLLHHLANPERQAQFALLTDWPDADTERHAGDDASIGLAREEIDALNARYDTRQTDPAAAPRFILLHRARRFSHSERRWIGWERKRGKLEQLVAALATGHSDAFLDLGVASRLVPQPRFLVTLDSDTELPPGSLRQLVAVAAHPSNRPRLDAQGRSVLSGYGILQPRIVTPLPPPRELTRFHWLFAGQCGIDPYSAASSEVYQDLFGEGSFTGKGLLDVQAVHAVLGGRLPEGRVLSHDLLEGALARCAALSDITVIEDAPFHADVAASRVHRWMRGDWQLLPILLRPGRFPMRAIHRWKMVDNLRRSLVAPASLALLLLALAGRGPSPWWVLALLAAAFAAGPVLGALAGFVPSRARAARWRFLRQATIELARALAGGLWQLALLLQQALMALDAIGRALYRMLVSRRLLLQWTTAATAQAQARNGYAALARRHWQAPVLALALLGGLLAAWALQPPGSPAWPGLAAGLCLLWAATPLAIGWASRPLAPDPVEALDATQRQYLAELARDTWRFFERCVGPQDHHLPPDNLQTLPHEMLAHRTSPTNIGLYLLSVACAQRFGWIDTGALISRFDATLATLGTLPRHRGHFLNWYDTQTLAPLLPKYVSTVDSGNLSGHLLATAQACLALAEEQPLAPGQAARLRALAKAFEHLAWGADFSFLYHPKRHLFHIGYRVAEQQLDTGFYDLLASESRLTSLLAIAKGDVPVGHWAALGRPFYAAGTQAGLRSWSGSMFEYLMPGLVLAEPPGSVLHEACAAALREQIAFAAPLGVPWGLSESAYAGRDHTLAYQYAPQGVPRLALRRTPPDELVIAPYATALAAQIDPLAALRNLQALQALGARSAEGFIEALDFTPARQAAHDAVTPVATFMSHHQGMSLVALANVLLDGVARRWGMANPQIEAVASLLQERPPREVPALPPPPPGIAPQALHRRTPGLLRQVLPGASAVEPTHVLSNGRYHVTLRANGAGTSGWGRLGISRRRDDALRDEHGSFFYLRSAAQPRLASITQHPAPDPAAHYQSSFHADRVSFEARWPQMQAHTTVWVSPEDDIEFRQVELRNLGDRPLEIELVSAFEPTLAEPRADEAHPAFSNLFLRAHWQAAQQALVFERRPRLAGEPALHMAHFLAASDPQVLGLRLQTDRQRWRGRNHAVNQPLGGFDAPPHAPAEGASPPPPALDTGLDPVCALALRLRIAPHGKALLTFATAAGTQPDTLQAVVDKYRQPSHVQRASLMSATLSGIRLRALRMHADNLAQVQTLTTALVLNLTRPPLGADGSDAADAGESAAPHACDRRLLWRFGLSGERPIILVSAGAMHGLGLLRTLAQALRLWAWGGVECDLVVLNAEPASYQMPLQSAVAALRDHHAAETAQPGGSGSTGFHLLRAEEVRHDELATLQALARIRLQADGRPLQHHLNEWAARHELALEERQQTATAAVPVALQPAGAERVSQGEFVHPGGEFRFEVGAALRPARPWINVLANPGFGCLLSEAGGGHTWAVNSRNLQLSAWSNDPVADPPGEWFLLQDSKTRQAWSVAPSAWGDGSVSYRVSHGQGHSTISHRRGDLAVSASWCVDAASAVKQLRLRIVNQGHHTQQLRVLGLVEWMMGATRAERATVHTALHRQRLPQGLAPDLAPAAPTERARKLNTLLCTQAEASGGFGGGTAFFALAGDADEPEDWTCDRRECFDARGRLVLPDHLGRRAGSGLDPCAALAVRLTLGAGESTEQVFLLGYAPSPAAARALVTSAAAVPAAQRLRQVHAQWDTLLGATTVATPDPLFDALVNRWLLYQTLACRLWARAGFYQAGGATGFRDQLQDAMALAWAAPQLLRAQILLAASRQFPEGDVQHWWHAPGGAGVRTHFSDDLLWLVLACVHHQRATGDTTLLDETVPFLDGPAIPAGAEDAYYTPEVSGQQASVYEHAARALDHSLRVGVHGLPLMGSGDWNDGMNRVGHGGRGESVWLGWFLCRLVADFAPLARHRGDTARAQRWDAAAAGWRAALLGPAWDGQWFTRAFFDDGQPLGSHTNVEGRIDLIAQAWAVLSGVAPLERQRQAMAAAETHLVDRGAGLLRLLDPPLAQASPSAGYIQAYPGGVRENGGQYAHAGVWALMAQAALAATAADPLAAADTVYRYFGYLSPAHRAQHPRWGPAYGTEPYAMAADVYTQPPWVGRGGWSWYTGSAAWLHRAAIESIFGLHQGAQQLHFTPCLPSHWQRAELTLRRDARTMRFVLVRTVSMAALHADALWLALPGAQVLLPGEALDWAGLGADSCFVVPLVTPPAKP